LTFTSAAIDGAWIIDVDPPADARGFFARLYDREPFASLGIDLPIPQINRAGNDQNGTQRGMYDRGAARLRPWLRQP
jgi:dTDP-4-dehydrorhamnose 3,5-epimerase